MPKTNIKDLIRHCGSDICVVSGQLMLSATFIKAYVDSYYYAKITWVSDTYVILKATHKEDGTIIEGHGLSGDIKHMPASFHNSPKQVKALLMCRAYSKAVHKTGVYRRIVNELLDVENLSEFFIGSVTTRDKLKAVLAERKEAKSKGVRKGRSNKVKK